MRRENVRMCFGSPAGTTSHYRVKLGGKTAGKVGPSGRMTLSNGGVPSKEETSQLVPVPVALVSQTPCNRKPHCEANPTAGSRSQKEFLQFYEKVSVFVFDHEMWGLLISRFFSIHLRTHIIP